VARIQHGGARCDRAATRRAKNSPSTRSPESNVQARARICDVGDHAAYARNAPSLEWTATVSPGRALDFRRGERAGKDPGMALPQRLLSSGLQPNDGQTGQPSAGQPSATPASRPTPNVTAPANPPSNSIADRS
jgi:hypothetical protein